MKIILIICYYYFPFRGIGAKRIHFLSKMLSERGYRIIVLKADNKYFGDELDIGLIEDDENIEVIPINVNNSLFHRYVLNYWKYRKMVKQLVTKKNISLLILTGGPFYYFPVGKYINLKYSIPYILDYRDNYFGVAANVLEWLHKLVFKNIWDRPSIKKASYIVNVTYQLSDLHCSENPDIERENFITILNGYDDKCPLPQNKINPARVNDKCLKVGIFGRFFYHNPKDVNVLLNSTNKNIFDTEIYVIGEKEEGFYVEVLKRNQESKFKFMGYKSYTEGMKILQRMDCLMLNNRQSNALGSKIFDYIYINKPIIAFASPGGEIDNLLSSFENSFCIYDDRDNISDIFEEIFSLKERKLDNKILNIHKYSRSFQLNKLINIIESIIG